MRWELPQLERLSPGGWEALCMEGAWYGVTVYLDDADAAQVRRVEEAAARYGVELVRLEEPPAE